MTLCRITTKDNRIDQLFDAELTDIDYNKRAIFVAPHVEGCVPLIIPFENVSYIRLEED